MIVEYNWYYMGNPWKMSNHLETNLKGKFQIVFNFEHTRFKVYFNYKIGNFTIKQPPDSNNHPLGHFLAQKMQLFILRRLLWPTHHFHVRFFNQPTLETGSLPCLLICGIKRLVCLATFTIWLIFVNFSKLFKDFFNFFLLELFNLLEIYCFGYTIIHRVLNVFVVFFLGFLVHLLYRALALYFWRL